ncbi:MAG: phosphoenolpyruvate carboxykinase (ATP) [Leptolinea sp.]|nr:phosphoenolpyruvate carboxykinase (ATP) [Leptolinea sp.]
MDLNSFSGTPNLFGLDYLGFRNLHTVFWNLSAAELVEQIIQRQEGMISRTGAIVVNTAPNTGRSPNDKFFVRSEFTEKLIDWGDVNRGFSPTSFSRLLMKLQAYFQGRDVFLQDMAVGADPVTETYVRIITERAWHSLVAQNLFLRLTGEKLANFNPVFTVIAAPGFQADPNEDGVNSSTFIAIDLERRLVLIGGTAYAGEIKKSVFTYLNFVLPQKNILPMHCAANVGNNMDTALFFGLSGTGKTTLSSDVERKLVGDDEHGWTEHGIFNYEGGCYAKTIRLRKELEPVIWKASHRFGTVLENVVMDPLSRNVDFDNSQITENTRAAYPIEFVENYVPSGCADSPRHIFFLCADAFGVLPPIALLNLNQAVYYFLSGYTAKIAGTETGLSKEPSATFSTCFAAPFLPLNPHVYADKLAELVQKNGASVWLVNTGWTGGKYGYGTRIPLAQTRSMINAALYDKLKNVPMRNDEWFDIATPVSCPGVPDILLTPEKTWKDSQAFFKTVSILTKKFDDNFQKYREAVSNEVYNSGPKERK